MYAFILAGLILLYWWLTQRGTTEMFTHILKSADPAVLTAVGDAAERLGFDPIVAQAICLVESGGKPIRGEGPAGEIGIMQVTPAAGNQIGLAVSLDSTLEEQAEAGVRYLKWLELNHETDVQWVIRAYNQGPTAATRDEKAGAVYLERVVNAWQALTMI